MRKLTLKAALELQSSFAGHITSSHPSHVEFPGKPTVLIPDSIADVERALRLAQAANRRVFVRSGHSVSATDLNKASCAARVGTGKQADVIVSLEAFGGVAVREHLVSVGASATTGELAKALDGACLFLPLDDNPTQSVISAVLSLNTTPFLCSGQGGATLRQAVVEAEVITTDAGSGSAKTVRNKALRDILAGRPALITKLVLDADAAKAGETERWARAFTAVYERKSFAALCDALFAERAPAFPERVDLSLRVTSAAYSMKLIIIRTTGHGQADADAAEARVQAAFKKAKLALLESKAVTGPGSSVAAWMSTGPGEAAKGQIISRFGSNAQARPFAGFRSAFLDAVDFAIGQSPRSGRERAPRVLAWAELQLTPERKLSARAEILGAHADAKVAKEARDRMAAAIPADKASPTAAVARQALVRRAPTRALLRGVAVLQSLTPTPGFALLASNRAGGGKIPGFKGEVFDKADGRSYFNAIQQYAVSSYSQTVINARMSPRYVAVPRDAADVVVAVTFAAKQGLKVVARSGGHQYCGMSSGGANTLLIDLRLFNSAVFSTAGPPQAKVGPALALVNGSKDLRDRNVVFPHGECPLVNLGGHVQTGGIGHQLRSLGAALDWVRSFRMVTRDPNSPPGSDVYVEREFTRPKSPLGSGPPTDGDVFAAVLGGGPSSWGVVTEISFDLVADKQYPNSAGFSYPYVYLFGETKEGFRAAMEKFRQWADRQSKGQLPPGIDLFLTVVSGAFPRPPALLVETMCTSTAGLAEIQAVVDAVDAAVPFAIREAAHLASSVQGPTPMSVIADEGVRKIGLTGLPKSGREFDLPYKKSLHITKLPFSAAFRDGFVELVNDTYETTGLKVVFQGVLGGGDFSANGQKRTTHMQRRDALVQVVFDVFYEDGCESQAEACQQRMKSLLKAFSGGADVRMMWGSFEDKGTKGTQLDMRLPATQTLYYDSASAYARLQQIKKYTDPKDLFHTSFTVQSPK